VNPLAVIGSRISRAATTTTSSHDTRTSRRGAELFKGRRRAGTSEETATLSLTPGKVISITIVVRNVPTSRFKESKGEFRELHLINETGSHSFESELSSFEVRSHSTRRSGILHISSLESRTSEVGSKSAGKRLSIDDSSSGTTKSSRGNVTSKGLAAASQPTTVQALAESESMNNFVHNADHVLFMQQGISSGLDVGRTDDSLTYEGSVGSRSDIARYSTGDITAGAIGFYHEEPISVDTTLKNGRSGTTADGTTGDLQASNNGILDSKGTRNVVQNGGNEVILDVASHRTTGTAEETVVAVCSNVGVTGEGSAVMVIAIGVEVFFNINDFGFFHLLMIVGTLVFKGVADSQESYQ